MSHEAWMLLAAGLLPAILRATAPILLAALGGLVSDLAGCTNVALEGLMLVAAFFAVLVSVQAAHWFPGIAPGLYPWIGCAGGLLAALVLAGLLAVVHLEWGGDLIIAGIAINILAAGLTVLLMAALTGDKGSTASLDSPVLPSVHIPGLQDWALPDLLLNGENRRGHHVLLVVALLAVPALWWFLRRSRRGTWLRAAGENPLAAAAAGIPVRRMRYLALLLSGLLAGLGGIYLSLGYLSLFQADMTAGRGFLALAAVFVGARGLRGVVAASVLFGASAVLATQLGASRIPPQLIYLLAPVVTLMALAASGARSRRHAGR